MTYAGPLLRRMEDRMPFHFLVLDRLSIHHHNGVVNAPNLTERATRARRGVWSQRPTGVTRYFPFASRLTAPAGIPGSCSNTEIIGSLAGADGPGKDGLGLGGPDVGCRYLAMSSRTARPSSP